MEDFGYQKNYDGDDKFRSVLKQIFLSLAALFSMAAFIYVTVSAYNYFYQDSSEIRTIKSPEGEIKVIEEEEEEKKEDTMQIDHKIYEDIFGSKKGLNNQAKAVIKTAPEPALPPQEKPVNKKEIVKNSEKNNSAEDIKNNIPAQKIVVLSDKKPEQNSKDLLTKMDGEKRDNTAVPAKKLSNKRPKIRVQLAAMTSKESAQQSWKNLQHSYPTLFDDLDVFIEKADLGKRGIFYRLQIGNFFNQVDAEKFCNRYVAAAKRSRADCIIVE